MVLFYKPLSVVDCSVQGRVPQLKKQTSLIILFHFFFKAHPSFGILQRSCCPHLNQEDVRLVLWLLKGKFSLYNHSNNEQSQERTDQSGQFQRVNTALL